MDLACAEHLFNFDTILEIKIWLYTKASDDKEIKHESNSLTLSPAQDIIIIENEPKEKEENINTDGFRLNTSTL